MVLAVLSYKYLKNVHPEGHRELIFNGSKKISALCKENSNIQGPKNVHNTSVHVVISKIYIHA
jgi:hypothetical protein